MLVWATVILLAAILFFILKSQILPGHVLSILPIIAALVIGTGFTETLTLAHTGMLDAATVACVFIFASVYFGTMSDAGFFDPIIRMLFKTKRFGKTVFSVVSVTAIIAMLGHLDGQGVTTLIITVPPMLIIFDKLKIKRTTMALLFVLIVGAMNLIPWGGPITRAAVVIDMDIMELYKKLVPIQIVGLLLGFGVLWYESRKEQKLGEFLPATGVLSYELHVSDAEKQLRRPTLIWFNMSLTVLVLISLFIGFPPHLGFLVGCAVALPVNYRTIKLQNKIIKSHAGDILVNVYTILGAGVMVGIMEGTDMFNALAMGIVGIIPQSMNGIVHIILGILANPLSLLLNTDALIYGILPIAVKVSAQFGVAPATVAAMFCCARAINSGICLTTASTYLGLGLMGIEYKDAFKRIVKYSFSIGVILVLLSAAFVR
jgi:CitMHS family citrate-Mg2+:H+ or citrate-Ca2+:H+ symporter